MVNTVGVPSKTAILGVIGGHCVSTNCPTTVDAAVRLLMSMVDESEQAKIAAMNVDDISSLHFGLGMWIRNNMGFYAGNARLLKDSGETEPDNASMVIIRAFREQLLSSIPKIH